MKRSTIAGLVTTGIVGVGTAYLMSDRKMRNKVMRDGKKMINKAEEIAHRVDIF